MGRRRPRLSEVQHWMRVRDGSALKRWRQRRGLNQRELAFLVKKSQTTIYLLETGQLRTITDRLAYDLARRLDVPWEDLFVAGESSGLPSVANGVASAGRVA